MYDFRMFYEKRTMIENIMASDTIDQKLDLNKIHKKITKQAGSYMK